MCHCQYTRHCKEQEVKEHILIKRSKENSAMKKFMSLDLVIIFLFPSI